ncbi:MAG: hypothetical protein CMN30_02050 [Sandaracinus sp.]|nr:hypothetical protein [Sandaracinus sp.]
MTEVLTVPTHFGDISELSAGLADRVDEERLILYGPTAYEEGATVGFAVLLMDGSPALEGVGRVTAAVDGGEERAPETRYDIVFDSLQLQGMSEVVYERIVLARQSLAGDEPATGEVSLEGLEEAEAADIAAEPDIDADWDSEATAIADVAQMAESMGDAPDAMAAFDEPPAEEAAPEEPAEADAGLVDEVSFEAPPAEDDFAEPAAVQAVEPQEAFAGDVSFEEPAAEPEAVSFEEPPAEEAFAGDVSFDEPAADVADVAAADEAFAGDVSFEEPAADVDDAWAADDAEDDFGASVAPAGPVDSLGPPPGDPPVAPAPSLPPAPVGFQIPPFQGQLMRPVHPPTWQPEAQDAELSAEPTGFFAYAANDLPVPGSAPRPDMDPSLRVQPAPRPGDEASPNDGAAPPQIPLPDDAEVAPAVEPESFAIEEDAGVFEDVDDEASFADMGEGESDETTGEVDLGAADVELAAADVELTAAPAEGDESDFADVSFDDDDAVAFEEDDRV